MSGIGKVKRDKLMDHALRSWRKSGVIVPAIYKMNYLELNAFIGSIPEPNKSKEFVRILRERLSEVDPVNLGLGHFKEHGELPEFVMNMDKDLLDEYIDAVPVEQNTLDFITKLIDQSYRLQ